MHNVPLGSYARVKADNSHIIYFGNNRNKKEIREIDPYEIDNILQYHREAHLGSRAKCRHT